jgi:hypothetical protein
LDEKTRVAPKASRRVYPGALCGSLFHSKRRDKPGGSLIFCQFDNSHEIRHNSGMNNEPNSAETPPLAESTYESRYYASISLGVNYQPTRPGIVLLLAWVIASALLILFELSLKKFLGSLDYGSEVYRIAIVMFTAGSAILIAANLVGGVAIMFDFFRGNTGRLQPGHWIVIVNALVLPLMLAAQLVGYWADTFIKADYHFVSYLLYSGIELLAMLAFLGSALRLKEPPRWKCGLGMLGLASCLLCLQYLIIPICLKGSLGRLLSVTPYAVSFFSFLTAISLFLIILIDISKGSRRDWLHWLGAVSPIISAMLQIGWQLAYMFLLNLPTIFK